MKFQDSWRTRVGGQTPGSRGGRESSKADVEGPVRTPEFPGLCRIATALAGLMSTLGNGGGGGDTVVQVSSQTHRLKWRGRWERPEAVRHLLWGPIYLPLARPATLRAGPTQAWLPAPPQAQSFFC